MSTDVLEPLLQLLTAVACLVTAAFLFLSIWRRPKGDFSYVPHCNCAAQRALLVQDLTRPRMSEKQMVSSLCRHCLARQRCPSWGISPR